MAQTGQGKEHEDPALDEDGSESYTIGYGASALDADNLVGEISIEAHARSVIDISCRTNEKGRVLPPTPGKQAGW